MLLLSVIIPIFDAAEWLDQCLTSITASIADDSSAVELILVDDGSTDHSGLICEKYASMHANIHLIRKPNGGVASARNAGLAAAAGKYIAWVDPDDYVSDQWFPAIRRAIAQGEPDVIVMDTMRFGANGQKAETYGRSAGPIDPDMFFEDVLRDIRMLSGLPNKVMKARLFENIRFDPSLLILEDFAALPDILRSAKSVYYIPSCLYYYRQHDASLLHHVTPERAFLSVKTALARAERIDDQFRPAAVTAVCCQILAFMDNIHFYADFLPDKSQTEFCRKYIRQHLATPLFDREVSGVRKLKFLLLASGLYGIRSPFRNHPR